MSHSWTTAEVEALRARVQRLTENGRYDEAAAEARGAIDLLRSADDPEDLVLGAFLNDLGVAYKFAGRYDDAAACYSRAAALIAEACGNESDEMASVLHNLGGLAHAQGDYKAGTVQAQAGLSIRERVWGPDDAAVAHDVIALGALMEGSGEWSAAEGLYLRGLGILRQTTDRHHLALAHNGLASVYQTLGRSSDAAEHYRSALAALDEAGEAGHPAYAQVLNNLATMYRQLGDDDAAVELLVQAHDLLALSLGPDHPVTLVVAGNASRVSGSPSRDRSLGPAVALPAH